nr:MAG TPA: hypothetical protein [Caudoviricetes sp.]
MGNQNKLIDIIKCDIIFYSIILFYIFLTLYLLS